MAVVLIFKYPFIALNPIMLISSDGKYSILAQFSIYLIYPAYSKILISHVQGRFL